MVVLPAPDGPDQGHGGSRRRAEADIVSPSAARHGGSRPLEHHLRARPFRRRRQVTGVRRVRDIGQLWRPQLEHRFHVDEGLADFAIGEAEDVQRRHRG
jgi:hypothetical protein